MHDLDSKEEVVDDMELLRGRVRCFLGGKRTRPVERGEPVLTGPGALFECEILDRDDIERARERFVLCDDAECTDVPSLVGLSVVGEGNKCR